MQQKYEYVDKQAAFLSNSVYKDNQLRGGPSHTGPHSPDHKSTIRSYTPLLMKVERFLTVRPHFLVWTVRPLMCGALFHGTHMPISVPDPQSGLAQCWSVDKWWKCHYLLVQPNQHEPLLYEHTVTRLSTINLFLVET